MAIAKKYLGTNESGSNYYDVFKKWIPVEEKTETTTMIEILTKPRKIRRTKSKKEEK